MGDLEEDERYGLKNLYKGGTNNPTFVSRETLWGYGGDTPTHLCNRGGDGALKAFYMAKQFCK